MYTNVRIYTSVSMYIYCNVSRSNKEALLQCEHVLVAYMSTICNTCLLFASIKIIYIYKCTQLYRHTR